ncbi:MAG TPA: B12-binding domain-containing radical SAM protein [Pirellulales bacterium]|nr:B12-binding domain-containing radical SAM protein [Pirellulales bacterium]
MRVVLWDTRKLDVAKDFAGGFGVGQFPRRGGWRGRIVRYAFKRDRRPVALAFAYLAAIFRKLGHEVEYSEDHVPRGADLYVFHPSLITLSLERQAMRTVLRESPQAKVFVTGVLAHVLPEAFADLPVTLVRGEVEQLLGKLDDALAAERTVNVGSVRDLDALPFPDWSPFEPQRFRVAYDFWKFPTAFIQQSRGCTFSCNYCPYIVVENKTRFRSPEGVVDEMREGMQRFGFRSFKFRDPLFGLDRKRVFRLAELIGGLPRKVQFSIEGRIDLLKPDVLRELKRVGLTSITVGIETPNEDTLRQYKRAPIKDDRQREFVAMCRGLGVRTVAGFMIGFPEDTAQSIQSVLKYAKAVGPTFANFNVVTPYPGTDFFNQVRDDIASFDFTSYNVYTPVMKYRHLSPEQVADLHARSFIGYYFRSRWLAENIHLLLPRLGRFVHRPPAEPPVATPVTHRVPAPAHRCSPASVSSLV